MIGLRSLLASLVVASSCAFAIELPSVQRRFDQRLDTYRQLGYVHVGTMNDWLEDGEDDAWSVTLVGGRTYAFVGVCDNDCDDFDFVLRDEFGAQVRADTASDAIPLIVFTPARSGRYRLQNIMADCTDSPCEYAVAFMRR